MKLDIKMLIIGNNSRLYKAFKDKLPSHFACSHRDDFSGLIRAKSVKKVVLLSHSLKDIENEKILNALYQKNVEICYVSTSAVCNPRNLRFRYPRSKRSSEIFINTYCKKYTILRFGLIEGLHDFSKFAGEVPYTSEETFIRYLSCFMMGELDGFYNCFEKKMLDGTFLRTFIYRQYKYVTKLPLYISRPIDLALKKLGYMNYGYVYEQ